MSDRNDHTPGISPAEYLRGALASKRIVNTSRRIDCAECGRLPNPNNIVFLIAPATAFTQTICELRLRINNVRGDRLKGTLHLRGTGSYRGRDYEFSAPVDLAETEKAMCLQFQWHTPDEPTEIEWAASLELKGKMGLTLTDLAQVTVRRPPTNQS
ncbi:MAG: hypothetical protein D6751_08350 [Deltaproteobacteria bacterium]|nr:MAG: hypothetical protein D6751_08350 [Deltaproteobacteria bacterium]